jgi:phosphorylase kinase alpha/beta subunit
MDINNKLLAILEEINFSLRLPNGLYTASVGEHYTKYIWLRDVFYQNLPNLEKNPERYRQTYRTLLDYFLPMKDELAHSMHYPVLPIKIDTSMSQVWAWNHKQMDAIMLILFGIMLGEKKENIRIITSSKDVELIQEIIWYYERMHYYKLAGTDAWEEEEEVHSHAIGAAYAAFYQLKEYGFKVDADMLSKCADTLNALLPMESTTKFCDMAQLQLIWPLGLFDYPDIDSSKRDEILSRVEELLVRDRGVIRYMNDQYYNIADQNQARLFKTPFKLGHAISGNELEWPMGFAYLALIYRKVGNLDKFFSYYEKLTAPLILSEDYRMPEGYYAGTALKNHNTPLGWANALTVIVLREYHNIYNNC